MRKEGIGGHIRDIIIIYNTDKAGKMGLNFWVRGYCLSCNWSYNGESSFLWFLKT